MADVTINHSSDPALGFEDMDVGSFAMAVVNDTRGDRCVVYRHTTKTWHFLGIPGDVFLVASERPHSIGSIDRPLKSGDSFVVSI